MPPSEPGDEVSPEAPVPEGGAAGEDGPFPEDLLDPDELPPEERARLAYEAAVAAHEAGDAASDGTPVRRPPLPPAPVPRLPFPSGVTARHAEPLARHTAWRTGGPCPWFVVVHQVGALGGALDTLKEAGIRWTVLGHGTRQVWRDGAFDRAILQLGAGLSGIERDGGTWTVGAGAPCAAFAWTAASQGERGAEALARVPGSIGAAVALDEGPWREHLAEVGLGNRGGVQWVAPEKARGKKLIVAARFTLAPDEVKDVQARTRKALRGARALPGWYAPPKRGTAHDELVRVQAAGVRLRGVLIPEEAPEMVVNVGRGPATDLKLLHKSALERVKKLRGVTLESTVKWTGRTA